MLSSWNYKTLRTTRPKLLCWRSSTVSIPPSMKRSWPFDTISHGTLLKWLEIEFGIEPKPFTNTKPAQHNEVIKSDINNVNAKDKTGDMSSQSKLKCWTCGGEHKQSVCPQRSNQPSNNNGKRNYSKRSDNSIQQSKGQNVGLVNDRSFGI